MTRENRTPFSARLKELREAAGLTQKQLAERAGIHTLTVSKLEMGIREPSWGTVQDLADALGQTVLAFQVRALSPAPASRGRPKKRRKK